MLKVLCLEDSPRDLELMRELLMNAGFDLDMDSTDVESEFVSFLRNCTYDLILSDFKLPGFDAFAALRWSMEICPTVPFICVSGTVGEETAIELLKHGAVDYVLKDRPTKLPSVIKRALEEAKEKEARQRAEELFKSQYTLLTALINSPKDSIIFSLDKNYRYTTFNEKHREEMKRVWNTEITIGMNLLDCMQIPELRQLAKQSIDRALKGEAFSEIQHQPEPDVYYEFSWNPVYQHSEVLGATVFIRDITEHERAEEALRESEKRLREAQAMAHLGFWTWDVKTGDVEWSEEVFKIFCLDPKEFTPRIDSILALSPWPEDHQRDQELIKRAIETHSPGFYEQKFLRPDQSIGHYYSTFRGNYDDKGDLISIVGTVLDITERKRVEETLRESEHRFRSTLDNMMEGCQIIGNDWQYLYINHEAELHNHRPKEELMGKRYMDMWPGIEETEVFVMIRRCLEERIAHHMENQFVFPDGATGWFDLSIQPVPEGVFILSMDITERKRAEEKILRQLEELHRWQDVTLGREDRNRQLKREVNELAIRLGEAIRYPSHESDGAKDLPKEVL